MATKGKDNEGSDKYVMSKPVPKKEENLDSNKATKNKEKVNFDLFLNYTRDTVIHDIPAGTAYTVRDLEEGYVDEDGYPTGKKRDSKVVSE